MKFLNYIKKSIFSHDGKQSTTRITSYIILGLIVALVAMFIVMEICTTTISNEILIVFASLLGHQLALLGINKKYESKQIVAKYENEKIPEVKKDNPEENVPEDNLV